MCKKRRLIPPAKKQTGLNGGGEINQAGKSKAQFKTEI
jgi:hypothetical protein